MKSVELYPGADNLDLHGPNIWGVAAELNSDGDVDPLFHFWGTWNVEAAIKVIAFHIQVHVFGNPLLPVINDDLVHFGVGPGAETYQSGPHAAFDTVHYSRRGYGEVHPSVLPFRAFYTDKWSSWSN